MKNDKNIPVEESAGENIVPGEEYVVRWPLHVLQPYHFESLGTYPGYCVPCSREIRDKLLCKDGGPLERRGSSRTSHFCLGV